MNKLLIAALLLCFVIPCHIRAQSFELAQADIDTLKIRAAQRKFTESLEYLYLKEYYTVKSERDSLRYNENVTNIPCSFYQEFEAGIQFHTDKCWDVMGETETLTFPKVDTQKVRSFIETLHSEDSLDWISPNLYGPPDMGPGCYFEIIQKETQTIVRKGCGC